MVQKPEKQLNLEALLGDGSSSSSSRLDATINNLYAHELHPDVDTTDVVFDGGTVADGERSGGSANDASHSPAARVERRKARLRPVARPRSTSPEDEPLERVRRRALPLFPSPAKNRSSRACADASSPPLLVTTSSAARSPSRPSSSLATTPQEASLPGLLRRGQQHRKLDGSPSPSTASLERTTRAAPNSQLPLTGGKTPSPQQPRHAHFSPHDAAIAATSSRTPPPPVSSASAKACGESHASPGQRRGHHGHRKGPPPTYFELSQREEARLRAATAVRQASLAVITQVEGVDTTTTDPATGEKVYVTPAALRRQQQFEAAMSSKLDAFLAHEERRAGAVEGRLRKEAQERLQQWLVALHCAAAAAHLVNAVRVARARAVLRGHFIARVLVFIRRKRVLERRAAKVRERERLMSEPPSKSALRGAECLAMLPEPALDRFVEGLVKRCHLAGEHLVYEGQPGTEALIFHRGQVELKPPRRPPPGLGTAGAHLRLQPQTNVALLNQPGWIMGETLLITDEPWEHSIVAVADTDVWVATRALFADVLAGASSAEAGEAVARLVDDRRAVNMLRYRSMTAAFVRTASPLFALWSAAGVARLLQCVRPMIFRRGDVVAARGQYGRAIVFIVQGRVEVAVNDRRAEVVREGQAVGEVALAMGKRDRRTSVRAAQHCDCWVLDRADYQTIVAHESVTAIMPAILSLVDENGKERERGARTRLVLAADEQ